MAMQLDYFYGTEEQRFRFYRIPKLLFTDRRFGPVSIEAKALYGFLLDRMSLSQQNGWLDSENRVYIYFTQEEAVRLLGCGKDKAARMFRELDGMGLIERHRRGLGRPAMIYVKNFDTSAEADSLRAEDYNDGWEDAFSPEPVCNSGFAAPEAAGYIEPETVPAAPDSWQIGSDENGRGFAPIDADALPPVSLSFESRSDSPAEEEKASERPKSESWERFWPSGSPDFQTAENPMSRHRETRLPDIGKSAPNYTEYIKTENNDIDFNHTYPIQSHQTIDDMILRLEGYQTQIKHNIGYEILLQEYPHDPDLINGVVDLLAESCAVEGGCLRVNRQNVPASVVRSRLLKLNKDHVNYVLECFSRNTTRIHNVRAYLLSAFYNAPTTMSSYYTAWVNHDLACQAS